MFLHWWGHPYLTPHKKKSQPLPKELIYCTPRICALKSSPTVCKVGLTLVEYLNTTESISLGNKDANHKTINSRFVTNTLKKTWTNHNCQWRWMIKVCVMQKNTNPCAVASISFFPSPPHSSPLFPLWTPPHPHHWLVAGTSSTLMIKVFHKNNS